LIPMYTGRRNEGLTLLEVLVAVSLLGIILAILYGAYISNVEAIERAREDGQVYQAARTALDLISRDLECALIHTPVRVENVRLGLIGRHQEIDGMAADGVDFTTVTHLTAEAGSLRGDLCEVGYSLEQDQESGDVVLYRRDDAIVDEEIAKGGRREELTGLARGLEITYEDSRGESHEEWNTLDATPSAELPSLIKIRLIMKDGLGREHIFVRSVHPELAERKKGEKKGS
jgi:general secretion pathway protein J